MDIKEQIKSIVEKITKDPDMKAKFTADPIKTIKDILGIDISDETIEKIVAGVKAKISGDAISGAFDSLKKLF